MSTPVIATTRLMTPEELTDIVMSAVQTAINVAQPYSSPLLVKKILTPEEVEAVYGFKVNTLANWRVIAKGPEYIQEGNGRIYYAVESIEAYLQANTKKTYI